MRCIMDYDQLFTFLTVLKYRNFSRAAEELNVTQPTVTARIKNLESELNCKLFDRSGHKLIVSNEGRVLLEYANKTLKYMNQAKTAIHLLQQPSVKIGFAPGFSHSIVLSTINHFKETFDISILLIEGEDSSELLSKVFHRDLDIAFIRNPKNYQKELEIQHIFDDDLVLIFNKDHSLAHKEKIKSTDLIGETIISYRKKSPLWEEIEDQLIGINYSDKMEVGSIEMIKSMVKDGWGISIIPAIGIDHSEKSEMEIRSFQNISNIPNKIYAVYQKDSSIPEYFDVLINSLKNHLKS
jgi:DNA-binding transcriptional LysR family regulator